MALTLGTGPFGEKSAGAFNFEVTAPREHVLYLEDSPRRVRAVFGGETVADSTRVKLLHETGHLPVYYFPQGDVRMDLLVPTDHSTHCPFKGDASYFTVNGGGLVRENAAWSYEEPFPSVAAIKEYLAFYPEKVDAIEEFKE